MMMALPTLHHRWSSSHSSRTTKQSLTKSTNVMMPPTSAPTNARTTNNLAMTPCLPEKLSSCGLWYMPWSAVGRSGFTLSSGPSVDLAAK